MHPLQGIVCYLAKLFSGLPRLLESPLRVTPHSSQPQAALRKPQKASEVSKAAQSERKQAPGREALGISTLQQVAGPASGRKGGGGRSPLQIGGRAPPSTTATSSKAGPAAPSGRRPRPRARRAAPRAGRARTPRFLPQALRPGPPPRPRPRRRPRLSRPEFQENAGAPRPAPAEFRAAAATPETLGGRAAPCGQGGPSAATGRAGSGPTPGGAGPPDSSRRPRPADPLLGAIPPPFREPFPPGPPSPELTCRLGARSLRFSSSSGSGASDRSDSLTAALRSATELRAPPSRRPDQQMGGAAAPPGFHWTGRRGAVPADGRSQGSLLPGLLPLRGSSGRLASVVSCLSVHPPPSRGAPSNSAGRKRGLLPLLESAMTVLTLRKDKRNERCSFNPRDDPAHSPRLGRRQGSRHPFFRKIFVAAVFSCLT